MNPKDLVGAKKAPLGVVPPSLVPFVAPAMAVGAAKYGPFNWREQPVQMMTYLEAAQRHILAFIDGQDRAEDTDIHHIAHAIAGLAIVADAIAADNVIDNRPPAGPTPDILREQDATAKIDDAEPVVYPAGMAKITPSESAQCPMCGVTAPDHELACPLWDRMEFVVEGWPVTQAEDGCYLYRGRHVHPLSADLDTFREIGKIVDSEWP